MCHHRRHEASDSLFDLTHAGSFRCNSESFQSLDSGTFSAKLMERVAESPPPGNFRCIFLVGPYVVSAAFGAHEGLVISEDDRGT